MEKAASHSMLHDYLKINEPGWSEVLISSFLVGALTYYVYFSPYQWLGVLVSLSSSFLTILLLRSSKVHTIRRVFLLILVIVFWVGFASFLIRMGFNWLVAHDRSYSGIPLVPQGTPLYGTTNILDPYFLPQAFFPKAYSSRVVGVWLISSFDIRSFLILGFGPWVVTGIIFGRAWCGWICWFGATGEALTFGRERWTLSKLRDSGPKQLAGLRWWIRYIKYATLIVVLILSVVFWVQPLDVISWSGSIGWFAEYSNTIAAVLILFTTFVLLPFMTKRKWCIFLCPVGAMFDLLGRLSPFKVKIDKEACEKENVCIPSCHTYALTPKAIDKGAPNVDCDACGLCMDRCPHGAIDIYFRGTKRRAISWFIPAAVATLAMETFVSGFALT